MLLIHCVHCGPRAEIEFAYTGEAYRTRPAEPGQATDEEWGDFLYNRSNPRGENRERWVHSGGCGQWFLLIRDTLSHKVLGTYLPGPEPRKSTSE